MQPTAPANAVTISKLKLLADYLCVAPLAVPLKAAGGAMFIPETASARERSQRGIVLAIGPGDWRDDGSARVPVDAAVGDLVFFGKYSGTEEELAGRTVLVMRETECRMRVLAGAFTVIEHEDPKLNHLAEDWCELCHGPEDAAAGERLADMRAEFVRRQAENTELESAGRTIAETPTRPCAYVWPATPGVIEAVRCDLMQTIEAVRCDLMQTLSADGAEWVGEVCKHRHPALVTEPAR